MALTLNGSTGLSGIVGSAGTPALQGTDTNTGYFFGTDILGLSTGGTSRLYITSDGKVGIGTTSPTELLDVEGSIECLNELRSKTGNDLKLNAGSANRDVFLQVNDSTLMTVQGSTGKVGIGTTSPNSILHIGAADNTNHEAILTLNNGGASGQEAGIEWLYEASTTPRAKIHLNASDQSLTFSTANSTALTIDSSQQVGIGTTSPASPLHSKGISTTIGIHDYPQLTLQTASTDGAADKGSGIMFLNHDGNSGKFGGNIRVLNENATAGNHASYMSFSTRPAGGSVNEVLRIDSTANVKIIDGDLIIGTNGHGIDFSASESGNVISGGSKLDDYEEGIYTPTITGASGSWTLHTNYNKLSYTKIGRMVHFSGYISIDGESSPSGNINVSLPFTVGANTGNALNKYSAVTISLRSHGSTNITNVIGAPQPATTYMNILSVHPDVSHTWMTHSDVDTEWNLRIGGSFYV